MAQTGVLITFYSRCGETESLALAAAVGAVQARASIRLRRLPDGDAASSVDDSLQCRENQTRMRREYVAPTAADVVWADAIIFAAPARFEASSPEWTSYFDLLAQLQSEGKLEGKVGAAVASPFALSAAILQLGFIAVPPAADAAAAVDAVSRGRRVAAIAGALKQLSSP